MSYLYYSHRTGKNEEATEEMRYWVDTTKPGRLELYTEDDELVLECDYDELDFDETADWDKERAAAELEAKFDGFLFRKLGFVPEYDYN